jgi:RimJ/RimL family protein N-acetyltransferase
MGPERSCTRRRTRSNGAPGTSVTEALVAFAFANGQVRLVRAHTLPEANASTQVLLKCGFHQVGTVVDPEDGPVWRWERGPSLV